MLNINPENVLAYFNRASVFIELGMYRNALEDYDKAIELYPDFAKAYMNRAYVKNLLGNFTFLLHGNSPTVPRVFRMKK